MSEEPQGTPWISVGAFAVTVACAVGFAVSYALDLGTEALGATIGGAFAFLALGLTTWSRAIDTGEPEYVEERALGPSPRSEYAGFRQALTEQPVRRTGVLWGMLSVAVASIGGAALFPLRSLWPRYGDSASPDRSLSHTLWVDGRRLVTEEGAPIHPEDLGTGSVVTAFAEGVDPKLEVDTTTVLLKVDPQDLELPAGRDGWVVGGVVAYSKLCTHAGCPVGLYADEYHQLLCPCHHSIFDVLKGAAPIEGPAARPLPQLPLGLNDRGELVARGDFSAPVSAGWWGYPT